MFVLALAVPTLLAPALQTPTPQLAPPIPMRIRSCVLGCSSGGLAGAQISCGVINIHVNEELRFRFTLPVDPSSVSNASAQVIDVNTGAVPPGSLFVDPADTRSLVFRPALTFDALGNPHFGLASNGVYMLRVPGFTQGDQPPFVLSTTGIANQHRLQCTVIADQGIADYVPGAPSVALTVTVVTSYDQNGVPNGFAQVPAAGATNVWTESLLTFDFDDVMNPATLLQPSTGQMPFIRVRIDADGNLATVADQTVVAGNATISIDLDSKTTRLVFDPTAPLPHTGAGPSLVMVDMPSVVKDIAGNNLSNPAVSTFRTEP